MRNVYNGKRSAGGWALQTLCSLVRDVSTGPYDLTMRCCRSEFGQVLHLFLGSSSDEVSEATATQPNNW